MQTPVVKGDALRLARKFHNLSQADLAKSLGISGSYLSEIESGRKQPTLEILGAYARLFKVPTSSLLLFAEEVQGSKTLRTKTQKYLSGKVLQMLNWIDALEEFHSDDVKKRERKPKPRV